VAGWALAVPLLRLLGAGLTDEDKPHEDTCAEYPKPRARSRRAGSGGGWDYRAYLAAVMSQDASKLKTLGGQGPGPMGALFHVRTLDDFDFISHRSVRRGHHFHARRWSDL
jgi:hypothetical protein